MYFVYASKTGERLGTDPRDTRKYTTRYNEYYFGSTNADEALEDAIRRTEATGEEHYVKELLSYPTRLSFTVENGGVFRPYKHNGNGEQYL